MSNQITLPQGWALPKFGFSQRVRFHVKKGAPIYDDPFIAGTIIGLEYQPPSTASDLETGWWYHLAG